jgi:hypothetical protein
MDEDILVIDITPDELVVDTDFLPIALTLDLNSAPSASVPQYRHNQTVASSIWTINHNLGYNPVVQAYNSGSQEIVGDIIHISTNQVVINFDIVVTGFARLI